MVALGAAACLANQDWANSSVNILGPRSVENDTIDPCLTDSDTNFHAAHVDAHHRVSTSAGHAGGGTVNAISAAWHLSMPTPRRECSRPRRFSYHHSILQNGPSLDRFHIARGEVPT